ncbi:MAG: DUF4376 domain-containing protein [Pseudomonadota bacterium]
MTRIYESSTGQARDLATAEADAIFNPFAGATLEQAREIQKRRINQEWARRSRGGTIIAGQRIETDETSQTQIRGALERLVLPQNAGRVLRLNTRTQRPLDIDLSLAETLAEAVGDFVIACAENERALFDAVDAAETVAAVRAIDVTAGWPS